LRHRGGAAPGAARVPGPVQPRVAVRTPPTSDARAGARPPQGASGVSQFRANPNEHEGRRGSRIDSEEGGRYLGIPPHHSQRTHLSVTINPVSSESGAVQVPVPRGYRLKLGWSVPGNGATTGFTHGSGSVHHPTCL